MSKYKAKRTEAFGIVFDSIAESRYYMYLISEQQAGRVKEIELQPKFEIIPAYIDPKGKKVRATYYIADFKVTYKDGRERIIDVKGVKTPVYRLKKKLFEYKYGVSIKEVYA